MQAKLRYWEYYGMIDTFTNLYERSNNGQSFDRLYDLIISKENILLAYRTVKGNKGSKTKGVDGKTIENLKAMKDNEIVEKVQKILSNYQPKKVRRVYIPKPNGDARPLGIHAIMDRIIQQSFKQVLEPIAEAKFYKHSYGFRPLRSAHHALARVQSLTNRGFHYVVDIDIKGFFDNINHALLIKQMWNIGIQDRKVLAIISKMLNAEIEGEGKPSKGTPQGGLLSPLLSNIVLNDLDQWVAGQWELFETNYTYSDSSKKYRELKKTNLKEGFIVRYVDDFKILCRDYGTAQKWFHAVRLYLKDRLKLDISPDKSKIVNLRKQKSEFLGFTIKVEPKSNKMVAQTGISDKRKKQIKEQYKNYVKLINDAPTMENTRLFNSFILGVHNYFKKATMVNIEFARLSFDLSQFTYNRLRYRGKYERPKEPSSTYMKFYKNNYKTFKIDNVYLFPIADVKTSNNMNFSQELTPFTVEGREKIHKQIKPNISIEINKLMLFNGFGRTVEYMDNRLSRYSMKNGKCEITGVFLTAEEVHSHHYKPIYLGGSDEFNNLRIIHGDIHGLIHATKTETINKLMNALNITDKLKKKINEYRSASNIELIS